MTYYDADLASSVTLLNGQLLDAGTTVHVEEDGDQYTLLGYYTTSGIFVQTPSQQIDASKLSNMIHSAGHVQDELDADTNMPSAELVQESNVPKDPPNAPEPMAPEDWNRFKLILRL